MDKPLSDKDKKDPVLTASSGQPKMAVNFAETSLGAYAPHSRFTTDQKSWDAPHKEKAWNERPEGRLAIRLMSRGILGAAFFTTGGLLVSKHFPRAGEGVYNPDGAIDPTKPLQYIAKLIDTVAGKPIKIAVNALGYDGERAVRFRPTVYDQNSYLAARSGITQANKLGRSLGQEAVSITFDFFCASLGDALGRDMAGWFDPNVKKKWMKDGHIDFPEALKSSVKSMWQYLSYNGGEDWAVAIPYAYYVRAQRNVINHFSPGFKYDSDRHLNGGSFKVDSNYNVIGNYNIEGAIDLQGRFTAYNIGTLMFREVYNYVAEMFKGKQHALYGSPDKKQERGVIANLGNFGKWVVRSFAKGMIYMTPSVPLFWITRTPQTSHRGLGIHKDMGILTLDPTGNGVKTEFRAVYANDHIMNPSLPRDVFFGRLNEETGRWQDMNKPHQRRPNPLRQNFDHNAHGAGVEGAVFNTVGRMSDHARELSSIPANWADKQSWAPPIKKILNIRPHNELDQQGRIVKPKESFRRFVHPYVNAAIAYTPYMYAKAEMSRLWDDGKMDMALERAIDGAAAINMGEFKAGIGEVWKSFLHQPFSDPQREIEGNRRKKLDRSPSVDVSRLENGYSNGNGKKHHKKEPSTSWQEHIIQGRPQSEQDQSRTAQASYVDREELRKLLSGLTPPSNSIH